MMGHTSGQWVYMKVSTRGLPANCASVTTLPNWSCSENAGAGTLPRSVPCKPDNVVGVELRPVTGAPVELRKPSTATVNTTSNASVTTERREAKRQFICVSYPSCINNALVLFSQSCLIPSLQPLPYTLQLPVQSQNIKGRVSGDLITSRYTSE